MADATNNRPGGDTASRRGRMPRIPSPDIRELPDRLLSGAEAAILLGTSEASLRSQRAKRRGPPWVKDGRSVKYRLGTLRAYIETNTHGTLLEAQ